ncbi:MAG: DUF1810 domain-containing protein [Clostridia bacterium]|nr:DUF1810 domain-containing protein [Clostridia bacterium]
MTNYYLERFLDAQKDSYECALNEIKNGRKESHWMWFIFPQLKELGYSGMAKFYGISDLDEAKAYVEHPILGARLREISSALLSLDENNPRRVMGHPDHLKLCSSMTLFAKATDDNKVFIDVINKFYDGNMDLITLKLISK